MFNDKKFNVDLGHRNDLDKKAILQKSKEEREKRDHNKR